MFTEADSEARSRMPKVSGLNIHIGKIYNRVLVIECIVFTPFHWLHMLTRLHDMVFEVFDFLFLLMPLPSVFSY